MLKKQKLPKGRNFKQMDEQTRKLVFSRLPEINTEIVSKHHVRPTAYMLAKWWGKGNQQKVYEIMKNNSATRREMFYERKDGKEKQGYKLNKKGKEVIKLMKSFYLEGIHSLVSMHTISNAFFKEYKARRVAFLRELESIIDRSSATFKIIETASEEIPDTIIGKIAESRYGERIAWIGGTPRRMESGKLVLVLSGGSARGIAYYGFLKALEENNIYPDIMVGTSAGALAVAAFGTGLKVDTLRNMLSTKVLKKVFTPIQAPFTLIVSGLKGILGFGFERYLKKILGNRKISSLKDIFIVATLQWPTKFGKVVIGHSSEYNGNIKLGSDIAAWQAVLGSCAIQGIIPPPKINGGFRAERLVEGEHGVKREVIHVKDPSLNDGSIVETLPILTAEYLLKEMESDGLIIAVNLMNINPKKHEVKESPNPKGRVARIFFRLANVFRKFYAELAPKRALDAFEITYENNAKRTLDVVKGKGNKILVNLNANYELSGISLTSIKEEEKAIRVGYNTGKELCRILLGKADLN